MKPSSSSSSSLARRNRGSGKAAGAGWRAQLAPLQQRWQALSARERSLTRLAAAAVAILLLWAVGLAPALRTLHTVELRRGPLEAEQQRMLALKAQADRLKAQPIKAGGGEDAARALAQSVRERLGDGAQLAIAGERATLTLRNVPATALAAWLAEARVNARTLPVEARLTRAAAAARPANTPTPAVTAPTADMNSLAARLAALRASGAAGGIGVAGGFPLQGSAPQAAAPTRQAAAPPDSTADEPRWNGTLTLALPPQR